MSQEDLKHTIDQIALKGKGILAADESTKTATRRLEGVGVASTEESRRQYRELLFSAPDAGKYLAGVILYEETLMQNASDGTPFPKFLEKHGILPGIKVDKGLIKIPFTEDEEVTQGLDGLPERLAEYKKLGAKFAKWRAVYKITDTLPSPLAISSNAEVLARYAAICQVAGIVPIVEPEVLLEGTHTIERCAVVSEAVLKEVFVALKRNLVDLRYIILKPSMVISGKDCPKKATPEQVAEHTLNILKKTVSDVVPTVNFLSGGQTPEQATLHLQLMNVHPMPWNLSFSYARALQDPTMNAWAGKKENVKTAQDIFSRRLKLNSLASQGKYDQGMEQVHS
ncbi:MAG: class I fructose-bisphosphate aldolase [Nanoarchaeota archaeon]|nr:class I fructose-bisphosphate aldolase [Nanoarchaeota archaeon]